MGYCWANTTTEPEGRHFCPVSHLQWSPLVDKGGLLLLITYPLIIPRFVLIRKLLDVATSELLFWRLLRYLSCPQLFSHVIKACTSILLLLSAPHLSKKVQLERHADSLVLSGLWKELFGRCTHKRSQLESRWWPSEINWPISLSKDWQLPKGDIKLADTESFTVRYIQFRTLHQRGKKQKQYQIWKLGCMPTIASHSIWKVWMFLQLSIMFLAKSDFF